MWTCFDCRTCQWYLSGCIIKTDDKETCEDYYPQDPDDALDFEEELALEYQAGLYDEE